MKLHRSVLLFTGLALAFTLTSYFRAPLLAAIASLLPSQSGVADVRATAEVFFLGFKLLLVGGAVVAARRMACGVENAGHAPAARIEPPAAGPIDPLLTLRAFALVQVLVGHLFMCVFVSSRFAGRLEEDPWLRLLAPAPWAGVWVFFTLSGYLMGKGFYSGRYTLEPRRVYRYLSNRFVRIVPIYVTAVLVVSAAFCPEIFNGEHLSLLGSILIFDYNGQERLNPIGALWSVSTEVQFYALVPALYWGLCRLAGERHGRAFQLAGAALACGLVTRIVTQEIVEREGVTVYVYVPLLANLDLFVLGMLVNPLLAFLRAKPWVIRWATVPNAMALIGGGYLVSSLAGSSVVTGELGLPRLWVYGPTVAAAVTMIAIVCCELGSPTQARAGAMRRMLLVGHGMGTMAYPLYVWHEPILLNLRKLAPATLSMGAAIKYSLIAALATWAVAEFVYRHIERPTEKWKASKRRPSETAPPPEPAVLVTQPVSAAEILPQESKAA